MARWRWGRWRVRWRVVARALARGGACCGAVARGGVCGCTRWRVRWRGSARARGRMAMAAVVGWRRLARGYACRCRVRVGYAAQLFFCTCSRRPTCAFRLGELRSPRPSSLETSETMLRWWTRGEPNANVSTTTCSPRNANALAARRPLHALLSVLQVPVIALAPVRDHILKSGQTPAASWPAERFVGTVVE